MQLKFQIVCNRLATAAMNVVYGFKDYPTSGPFLKEVVKINKKNDSFDARVHFDDSITFNAYETHGFYICCNYHFRDCNVGDSGWKKVSYGSYG